MRNLKRSLVALGVSLFAVACGGGDAATSGADQDYTSNDAKILEFAFKGEVVAGGASKARQAITTQLQYLQGALTADVRGNAQASMPRLENIVETKLEDGKKRITYDARLAVAWPNRTAVPSSYEVVLPIDTTALDAFNEKYDGSCGRNEYGLETFWHDFDPTAASCKVAAEDALRVKASVAPHAQETKDKYPEYDKVWEDNALDVVMVFGIISSNTPYDQGATTREHILGEIQKSLADGARTENAKVTGVIADSTVTGTYPVAGDYAKVNVTALLVEEVASAGAAFEARYAELSTKADLIVYEGHSGLGKNINTLARKTGAEKGKYQLMYLYGCQTLGYLEPSMHDARIALNGAEADPEGTKFLDVLATALPAYGDDGRSTLALYRAMLDENALPTYNDLLKTISPTHLAVVFGEHDNSFAP